MIKTLLLLLITSTLSYSQTPNIIWSKYFGGYEGEAKSIQKTTDGGYIVAGIAASAHAEAVDYHGSYDGFVVKLNSSFQMEWSKCYGSTDYESISQIKQTSDGGYIFVGNAGVNYPTAPVGTTQFDYWIVKIDSLGNLVWEKKYGGSNEDGAKGVDEIINNQYIVSGYSRSTDGNVGASFGYSDYWVLKLDSNGTIVLNKKYGGPEADIGYPCVTNPDGSYVVAGETFSETGQVSCRNPALVCESDFWVVKANNLGVITWAKCFGSAVPGTNYFNTPYKMIKTSDNGYAVVGSGFDGWVTNTFGLTDFWIRKIDADGVLQWKKFYGGTGHDKAYSVKQTMDGGYILVGSTYSNDGQVTVNLGQYSDENAWIIKINSLGDLEWQKTAGSSNFGYDYFSDVIEIGNNDYVAVGYAGNPNDDCIDSNDRGFWITKISTNNLSNNSFSLSDFELYPNPTDNLLKFKTKEPINKITIYDISGRKVFELNADNITQVDIAALSKGIYTLTVSNESHSTSRKIVKN